MSKNEDFLNEFLLNALGTESDLDASPTCSTGQSILDLMTRDLKSGKTVHCWLNRSRIKISLVDGEIRVDPYDT